MSKTRPHANDVIIPTAHPSAPVLEKAGCLVRAFRKRAWPLGPRQRRVASLRQLGDKSGVGTIRSSIATSRNVFEGVAGLSPPFLRREGGADGRTLGPPFAP